MPARTVRDLAPRGRIGDLAAHVLGDRYRGFEQGVRGADIVHAEELSYWFAAEAARHKTFCGYKLVLTVWETIPLLEAFRNRGRASPPEARCSSTPTCSSRPRSAHGTR